MKNALARFVRKLLPAGLLHVLEEVYRTVRVRLIAYYFGNPAKKLKVIAVTGTNGKTTTVNFINEILKTSGKTTAMFSTAQIEVAGETKLNDLNATVGTVVRMQQFFRDAVRHHVDYVVMEFPSHALVQHKLDGVPVEVAVMTNLTQDHLDYHKTMQKYAEAKALLFRRRPRYTVLNRDDEWYDFFSQFPPRETTFTYGAATSDVAISDFHDSINGAAASFSYQQTSTPIFTMLPGKFNIYNAAAAAAACLLLGVGMTDVVRGIKNVAAIPGRFEFVETGKDFNVIVDYAHTPDGLEKILTAVDEVTDGDVTLVFGSCGDRDKGKRPIMGRIAADKADHIVLTDEENYSENADAIRRAIHDGIVSQKNGRAKTIELADRRSAILHALRHAKTGDTVLITGLGHEVFRVIDGKKVPWNDTEIVKDLVNKL